MARKDNKPVGFAIVEFADGVTAERTCNELENLTIGGQKVELELCIPGHTVPEAFSRQMSLLVRLVAHFVVCCLNHIDTVILFTIMGIVIEYKGHCVSGYFFIIQYVFFCI